MTLIGRVLVLVNVVVSIIDIMFVSFLADVVILALAVVESTSVVDELTFVLVELKFLIFIVPNAVEI